MVASVALGHNASDDNEEDGTESASQGDEDDQAKRHVSSYRLLVSGEKDKGDGAE